MSLPIITNQQIEKYKPHCFVIYSDNILESTTVLDLISRNNSYLEIIGVSYEPIDQPIYLFKEKNNDLYLCVKVAGKYENWELPQNVDEIVAFIDKPDIVIIDASKGEGVFVGETTGTANVGNSQWQREGRKISAAIKKIPMIYQTYYSGTDRSMFKPEIIDSGDQQGQVREPTCLQAINHFIYSLRYKVPSLVIYYPNPEYDSIIGFNRDNQGRGLFKHYISLCLLCVISKKYKAVKKEVEKEIYERMLEFTIERVSYRKSRVKRIDKDFPVQPINIIFKNYGDSFIKFLVDFINDDASFNEKFNLTKWDFKTFEPWSHRYGKTPLMNFLQKNKLPTFSYLRGATKSGFVLDTQRLISILDAFYPKNRGRFGEKLNANLPTLIIPTLMFQKSGNKYIYKVDPGTGEVVAFAELFARDIKGNKAMNTLIYVHVPGPKLFSTNTKLFRAFRRYADCLIINEKIYEL